jgi:hypothetical protein
LRRRPRAEKFRDAIRTVAEALNPDNFDLIPPPEREERYMNLVCIFESAPPLFPPQTPPSPAALISQYVHEIEFICQTMLAPYFCHQLILIYVKN